MKQRKFFWILTFVLSVLVVGALATFWNIFLVQNYYQMKEMALNLRSQGVSSPWIALTLGSIGFVAVVVACVLFFVKLLREMRVNQLQREFLARISHELKTPIATLELTGGLIRKGRLTEDREKQLWKLFEGDLARLKNEVSLLLEASRFEHGRPKVELTRVRLEEWITGALAGWKLILGEDGILRREGERLDFDVEIDPTLMKLVTDNLVDNAKKFAKKKPVLSVSTSVDKEVWTIEFKDEGWGFDPAESKKIFERFHRSTEEIPGKVPGTGLGLFLAQQASKQMGIRLKASSKGHGEGASFVLRGKVHV